MQKEMKNHDEDVTISSILTEHQSKERFRDSRKNLKFVKMRNALGRHTYGNQVRPSQLKVIYYFILFSNVVIYEVVSSELCVCVLIKHLCTVFERVKRYIC